HVDTNGNRLENPIIVGVIRMDGSDTGFVHKLLDKVEDIEIGMEVEAVFAPKERRRGSINDIVGFRRIR
ncbi:MAG: OB-fold domain-containing protein, partial [candidate division WOR-3 bacterium]